MVACGHSCTTACSREPCISFETANDREHAFAQPPSANKSSHQRNVLFFIVFHRLWQNKPWPYGLLDDGFPLIHKKNEEDNPDFKNPCLEYKEEGP